MKALGGACWAGSGDQTVGQCALWGVPPCLRAKSSTPLYGLAMMSLSVRCGVWPLAYARGWWTQAPAKRSCAFAGVTSAEHTAPLRPPCLRAGFVFRDVRRALSRAPSLTLRTCVELLVLTRGVGLPRCVVRPRRPTITHCAELCRTLSAYALGSSSISFAHLSMVGQHPICALVYCSRSMV